MARIPWSNKLLIVFKNIGKKMKSHEESITRIDTEINNSSTKLEELLTEIKSINDKLKKGL